MINSMTITGMRHDNKAKPYNISKRDRFIHIGWITPRLLYCLEISSVLVFRNRMQWKERWMCASAKESLQMYYNIIKRKFCIIFKNCWLHFTVMLVYIHQMWIQFYLIYFLRFFGVSPVIHKISNFIMTGRKRIRIIVHKYSCRFCTIVP